MKKPIFVLGIAIFAVLTGCDNDNGVSNGDTICGITSKRIYANDVLGTIGPYSDYEAEFIAATGCTSRMGCTESMEIKEEICIDNITVK